MKNYFDKEFELRYFEMDKSGCASSITMLTLLQETAADHCASIGHDLFSLMSQNLGWVLLSGIMKMDRYPKYKEKIVIRTWLSKYQSIRGIRENVIYDADYNVIGRAKGLWLFFDIEKRRPTKILNDFKEQWSFCEEVSIEHDISSKIDAISSANYMKKFKVNIYDTDTNKHVNNIRYLQWLVESVPEEITDNYYLHSIDGRFLKEAEYGDVIVSLTNKGEDENSFVHAIHVEGEERTCATAKTVWKKILR
ncbi:acyl-ACP thioesterase [Sulfurimonas aquatica]|uniref:Acyl-ACP thioesterase n=1 Tax=Sulfurimonas aquatica TaxID=2672570 RepID=A0A975B097_9BACT|nr:acyl-ACP thioesterase domain-containing protein [Sulfurimonas aquatica]QSZ41770.1 acyl-ACP thioesterase [Sulfurimonas aquatica]